MSTTYASITTTTLNEQDLTPFINLDGVGSIEEFRSRFLLFVHSKDMSYWKRFDRLVARYQGEQIVFESSLSAQVQERFTRDLVSA